MGAEAVGRYGSIQTRAAGISNPRFILQGLITNGPSGKGPMLVLPIVALLAIIISSSFIGRIFCGYSCPIGAVQELLYHIPTPKIKIGNKWVLMGFRWAFLGAMVISGILTGISLLSYLGAGSFFGLDFGKVPFFVFSGLLLISIFFYRPFCRLFCPIGALMAISALIRGHRFRRNESCRDCGKCETECPVGEAADKDRKMECYACSRCSYVCPFNALDYSKDKRR